MLSRCLAIWFFLSFALVFSSHGQSAIVSGTVSDEFGNLPGAKVVLEGTTYHTYTDVNGNFEMTVDPGVYRLKSLFVMYVSDIQDVVLNPGDSIYKTIVLRSGFSVDQLASLGTRSKPRSLLETTAPVDIISPQQITNSSQIELSQILHYLTPSFHSTHQTISDGTDFVDPVTLRGLGPDQVLVLVNGKRRHSSSLLNVNGTVGRGTVGTDLNAIPVAAIDRIEILRDGAASQYGSDAIAGVINIVLKERTGIIDIDARLGTNSAGDGLTEYTSANYGLEIGDRGFVNLSVNYVNREATNRSEPYTGVVFSDDPLEEARLIEENRFFSNSPFDNNRLMQVGNAETQNLGFFFNSEVRLSKNATFYGHGGRNFREGKSRGFYRFPHDTAKVVHELFPVGFSPEIVANIQDRSLTLGVRGVRRRWNLDFSNSSGSNKFDFSVRNSNNASLGVASPKFFYAGGFQYSQNTSNFDLSRTFPWFSGVNFALGTETRIENYQIIAGEEASYINGGDSVVTGDNTILRTPGAQVFPGFQPENELNKFRTNVAWYVDVETKLTEKLTVELAGRYQIYNDFDRQSIWKVATGYKVWDQLNLRGGYSTGFRAPSLHQVFFNNVSTQFQDGQAVQVGTFNNESAVTNAFNIEGLKPELSKHLSLGFSSKAFDSFTFTFDYYNILIEDRIVLSGRFDEGYQDILGPIGVGAAQFFTNAVDSKTNGADIVTFYTTKLGKGKLETSLAANITRTRITGELNLPEGLVGQEEVVFNREERSRIETVQPNFKLNSSILYKQGKMQVELRNTWFGEVKYVHPSDGNPDNWVVNENTGEVESRDQVFSPKLVTDATVAWQFTDNLKVSVGGNNVFDVYPDRHNHSFNFSSGNFPYSRRTQQFGVKGAYYFGKVLISL